MGGFTVLGGLFAAGYAFTDLDLTIAVLTVAAYLLPTLGLCWVALRRQAQADVVFKVLWVAVFGLASIRAFVGFETFQFFDRYGPVDAISVLMFAFPLALWARTAPRTGGWMLLALGVLPSLLVSMTMGTIVSGTSLDVATGTIAVVGGLFIYAAGQFDRIELAK
jgi:hypothetical protein